jgi:hypothetical protein
VRASLEGSRFVVLQICLLFNKRLPGKAPDLALPSSAFGQIVAENTRPVGNSVALGNSREPPAANLQKCHMIKRLPSRPPSLTPP